MIQEFKKGDIAILDEEFNNSSEVEILEITSFGMYATVKAVGEDNSEAWAVMTYRLTPKTV